MTRLTLAALAAVLLSGTALAHDYALKALTIDHPFTRATPPGSMSAGAFMTIENAGKDADRLVGASSSAAAVVQIHEMVMDGSVMRMREVKGVDIKPGTTVALKPGSYHVMLTDLKRPFKEGEAIPMTLTFEKAGSIDVKLVVEAMGAAGHSH